MDVTINAAKKAKSDGTLLATLQFSDALRPNAQTANRRDPRDAVLGYLNEQAALVTADLEEKDLTVTKTRVQKNEKGERVKVDVLVHPRRSYWMHEDRLMFNVKLGNICLELAPGKTSVVGGLDKEALLKTISVLRQALTRGELDDAIQAAAKTVRERVRKRNSPPLPS